MIHPFDTLDPKWQGAPTATSTFAPHSMSAHIPPISLYIPSVGHQQSAPEDDSSPVFRRSRSANERFAFFRRAASAGPPQQKQPQTPQKQSSLNMSTTASKVPTNLSPRNAPDLNTLPDPRSPSPLSNTPGTPGGSQHHPDLSNEVATLSAKLINAINHQTNLDDSLQETRHELDSAKQRIVQLEREAKEYRDALAQGLLVRRADTAQKEERLQNTINDERRKRSSAEREKKGMEQELESLTSQLFEEANRMVVAARKERETADRRVDQLKAQLTETETLLASHQDQLAELKSVMQDNQNGPTEIVTTAATAPNSPVVDKVSSKTFDYPTHQRNALSMQNIAPPESPLHFTHLIHPVVRVDHQAYEDFITLLRTTRNSNTSRVSSGSYVGLNVLGLGSKDNNSQSSIVGSEHAAPKNSSRSSSAQNTPTVGYHSPNPSLDSSAVQNMLKDSRYYKRALVEDIEPTLRLDTAPALSWLARRTVIQAIAAGKLVIEPYPSRHAFHSPAYACALCGEVRTNEEHLRRYRFRTSDSDEAQRYPLCDYCLARVRTACDFISFLREAGRGHMRNETAQDCLVAWEECIRLRERMFWSRIGGGVVPTSSSDSGNRVDSPSRNTSGESDRDTLGSDSDARSIRRADSGLSTGSEIYGRPSTSDIAAKTETIQRAEIGPPVPLKNDAETSPGKTTVTDVQQREEHPLAQVTSVHSDQDEVHEEQESQASRVEEQPDALEETSQLDNGADGTAPDTTHLMPPSASTKPHEDPSTAGSPEPTSEPTPEPTVSSEQDPPEPIPALTQTTSITQPSTPLLSPALVTSKRFSTSALDPAKPHAARHSKVASLASRFSGLDSASATSGSPPRTRPTSMHSARERLRGDSTSPIRLGVDAARRDSNASAGKSPERPVTSIAPATAAQQDDATGDAESQESAPPSQRNSGVRVPGSFW